MTEDGRTRMVFVEGRVTDALHQAGIARSRSKTALIISLIAVALIALWR
jgi:hypothetical protein